MLAWDLEREFAIAAAVLTLWCFILVIRDARRK